MNLERLEAQARREWPEEIEIDGETYEQETVGAYKEVYRSEDGENVALLSSRGESTEEQAFHTAGVIHNEQAQREYGITTATDYSAAIADVDGDEHPAAVGEFRGDLVTHGELDDILEDRDEQERVYNEIFVPIRELASQGMTTASPLDFINVDNRDSSNIIFDTRNFGHNPETDGYEVIDNGELEARNFGTTHIAPDADLSDYDFIDAEDFAYRQKHDSVEEFVEDNKIDREAQQMLEELL